MTVETIKIEKVNDNIIKASKAHWDSIAKPIEGLGKMEELITKIAGAQDQVEIDISKKAVLAFCSDNGVVKQNISQVDSSVTANIVKSMQAGTSSVAVMAKAVGADVFVVDVGVLSDEEGVINKKYMYGTDDISVGPAMSMEVAKKTIATGIEMVHELKEKGYNIVATGEAGIGNTTTSSAVAGALLNFPADVVTGKGSGLSDDALLHKIEIVKKSWEVNGISIDENEQENKNAIEILAKVGGLDIAALTGAYLGAAECHMPIVMDGIISAVAALCAYYVNPLVADYIIPSHMSMEPAMIKICEKLSIAPIIYADMHLGEGTGAVLMLSMLDTALAVYRNGASFDKIDVKQYERF